MENESKILDSIEKYVFEENKIVTYKWLSKQHSIHNNISKRLLSTFANKTNENISVCYLIGGVLSDGSHKIVVGCQKEISDVKQKFKDVTSEHVYSVQNQVGNTDLKLVLYSADSSATDEHRTAQCYSSIKFDGSILREASAIAELKKQALTAANSKSAIISKTNTINGKKQLDGPEKESASKDTIDTDASKSNGPKTTKSNSPKKTGIAAMFAVQQQTKKTENKAKVIQQPAKDKPKGLSAFFNQSNGTKKPEKVKEVAPVIIVSPKKDKENQKTHKEVVEEKLPEQHKHDSLKEKDKNKSKAAKKGGNKRKKSKDKEDGSSKKRKRIVMMSDSESSEEEGYRSPSPEQREPTPPPPVSDDEDLVPTTPQVDKNSKKKKKKLVEKTFMDSDGFLVTNKEYTMVSESEEEEVKNEVSAKKPSEIEKPIKPEEKVKVQEPKKKSSPQKAKQSSITNFFKKS